MTRVLVTGASGGIGSAICSTLAARGVSLVLHYQSGRAAAEATRAALAGQGHTLVGGNLTHADDIERLWREASAAAPIDAVVNNAGIFPNHPPLTTDYAGWTAAWQRTLAINLTGPRTSPGLPRAR
jgi:NAD(P)-dependent dehydrogenase (short-subunit alcohol dehydrogenase family)